jgi:hypothetical protein
MNEFHVLAFVTICVHKLKEFPLHENPHSKGMGYDGFTIHTSIAETQFMISIDIHAFNKGTSICGY